MGVPEAKDKGYEGGQGGMHKGGAIWLTWPSYSVKSSMEMVYVIGKVKTRSEMPIEQVEWS